MPKIDEFSWEELKYKTGGSGEDGEDGEDGKSAYQIAVDNGFAGTELEWLNSLKATGLSAEELQMVEAAKQQASAAATQAADKATAADTAAQAAATESGKATTAATTAAGASKSASDAAAAAAAKSSEAATAASDAATKAQEAGAAKARAEAILAEMQKIQNSGGALTPEQQAALNRFVSEVGNGSVMKIANAVDIKTSTTGNATVLDVASYSGDSQVGGGKFYRVLNTTPLVENIVVASKDGNRYQLVPDDGVFTWEQLGWVPTADFSVAFFDKFRPLVAQFGGRMRLPNNKNTVYMSGIVVLKGLVELDGNNCKWVWKAQEARMMCAIYSSDNRITDYPHGIKVHNMNISYDEASKGAVDSKGNAFRSGGVWIWSANNSTVCNNKIKTWNLRGILARSTTLAPLTGCDIFGNEIYVESNVDDIHGIEVDSDGAVGGKMDSYYSLNHAAQTTPFRTSKVEVWDNYINGSYYGIVFSQVDKCHAFNNTTEKNTRGLVMQNACSQSSYLNNVANDFKSSAMLCNYVCENNVYSGNRGTTSIGNGQAPIQITVGSRLNKFTNNHFISTSDAGQRYAICMSVDCVGNLVDGNSYTGNLQRAGILIESAWKYDASRPWSYSDSTALPSNMASKHTVDNVIRRNVINSPSAVPAVVLHAVQDSGGTWNIDNCTIEGNVVVGSNHNMMIRCEEVGDARITRTTMGGNIFPSDTPVGKFKLGAARMYANISRDSNRPAMDWENAVNPVIPAWETATISATGVIEVPKYNNSLIMLTRPPTATNLVKLTGGKAGQEVIIRLDANITVKNDNDFIRLPDGDIVAANANRVIRLVCLAGSGVAGTDSKWAQLK